MLAYYLYERPGLNELAGFVQSLSWSLVGVSLTGTTLWGVVALFRSRQRVSVLVALGLSIVAMMVMWGREYIDMRRLEIYRVGGSRLGELNLYWPAMIAALIVLWIGVRRARAAGGLAQG